MLGAFLLRVSSVRAAAGFNGAFSSRGHSPAKCYSHAQVEAISRPSAGEAAEVALGCNRESGPREDVALDPSSVAFVLNAALTQREIVAPEKSAPTGLFQQDRKST